MDKQISKPKRSHMDKQTAAAEILKWLEPRVNEYYAPFIAEAVLNEKLESAGLTLSEFREFVSAQKGRV